MCRVPERKSMSIMSSYHHIITSSYHHMQNPNATFRRILINVPGFGQICSTIGPNPGTFAKTLQKVARDFSHRFLAVSDRFGPFSDHFGPFRSVFLAFRTVSDRFFCVSDRFERTNERTDERTPLTLASSDLRRPAP